jgi:hypothetical protein
MKLHTAEMEVHEINSRNPKGLLEVLVINQII